MYYKVDKADGGELVIEAETLEEAQHHFRRVVGKDVPDEVLTWTEIEVGDIPNGTIPLTFETK